MSVNARYSLPAGSVSWKDRKADGANRLPHIDDIIAPTKRLEYDLPIRKLLDIAESSLRQAEFSREIRKPAPALQDFLKASIIVIQLIANHRDFQFARSSKELSARYDALLKKIKVRQDDYARIKEEIISDNKRTGVQATAKHSGPSQDGPPSSSRSSSDRSSATNGSTHGRHGSVNGIGSKSKPAVQPKPKSLSGTVIAAGHARANSMTTTSSSNGSMQDLAARFANLRGPQPSPGQDPRIKTHPINIPPAKPAGPRDMPPPQKPKLALDSTVPALPKLPDAIYSPARGMGPGENSRPPTSNPRTGYGRTSSSLSAASSPNLSRQTSASDYFSSAQGYSNGSALSRTTSRESSLDLPRGDVITAENLVQVMKSRATILLIDVRPRDEFDDGHIMHSAVICIEPTILDREDISADEIGESLVLAPNPQQALFGKRNTYDMVVYYDERSAEMPKFASSSDESAPLISLHRALTQFSYGKELKNTPKILKGGLDAWVDMMGPGSLQSTADPEARPKSRGRVHNITIERRRSKYVVKQLKPDDIRQWEATIKKDDRETAESPTFVRSKEDFLRRFPSVSAGQESMSSPTPPRPRYGSSHKNDLESELPSPPSRPAPALPRQSYSSLSPGSNDHEVYDGTVSITQAVSGSVAKPTSQQSVSEAPQQKFYTGLNNPHNWCYANSLLQSLLASPGFGRELADSESVGRHKVPRKADEKVDHPQLMIRIISNLFHWMSSGKFPTMKAQTLMDYVRHLCKQNSSPIHFGGANQQDAQEFMTFLLDVIHDETNIHRDVQGKESQPLDPSNTGLSVLQTAQQFWQSHLQYNQSIIDRYWRLLEVTEVQCRACSTRTFTFSSWFCLMLPVSEATTLEAAMKKKCAPELIEDFRCDKCAKSTMSDRKEYYARLPPLVCVVLNRFGSTNRFGQTGKCTDKVTWDFNSLDLSPYFLSPRDCDLSASGDLFPDDRAFRGPFEYECYAVLVHQGSSVNSGHYYAYVRDQSKRHQDPFAWFCCNDERVSKVRIGCGGSEDARDRVFKTGSDAVPYMAFFRRKQGR